jgi:hypothetical protein
MQIAVYVTQAIDDHAFLVTVKSGGMNLYRFPGCSKGRRIESKSDLNRSKPVDIQKAEARRSECGSENGTGAYSIVYTRRFHRSFVKIEMADSRQVVYRQLTRG